jgi:hypothetical protein
MNEKLVQLRGKGRYGEALTILGILWDNRGPIQTYVSVRGSVKEALAKQARERDVRWRDRFRQSPSDTTAQFAARGS